MKKHKKLEIRTSMQIREKNYGLSMKEDTKKYIAHLNKYWVSIESLEDVGIKILHSGNAEYIKENRTMNLEIIDDVGNYE